MIMSALLTHVPTVIMSLTLQPWFLTSRGPLRHRFKSINEPE